MANKKKYSLMLCPDVKEAAEKKAHKEDRTLSVVINRLLKLFIKKGGK